MKNRLLALITLLAAVSLPAAPTDPLVVHEWGTFTSVQGADGVQRTWTPTLKTDLPGFVYSRAVSNGGLLGVSLADRAVKGEVTGKMRMETPVIYFYSNTGRTVDVQVLFPQGRITEWYPQATNIGPYELPTKVSNKSQAQDASRSLIEWNDVNILARDTQQISASKLIRDRNDPQANHYYAARETDANFLRVSSTHTRGQAEHERDLFYRGVGFDEAPLTVTMDSTERELTLSTASAEPLTDIFVLTIRQGLMRYQKIDRVTSRASSVVELDTETFGDLRDVRERVMRDVATALVGQGLYAKEASAMIDTWKDQWFAEEGTRVLYLLPRTWTDKTLPLKVSPQPDSIVRVMVGRAELITPTLHRELRKQIVAYSTGDAAAKRQAVAGARELALGRFFEPALQMVLGRNSNQALTQAGWELMAKVNEPEIEARVVRAQGLRD